MDKVSFVSTSAATYDLTSVTVNAKAREEVTPREGGFVAHNVIDFTNSTAPTLTNKVMNVLKLLKVPNRTVITAIRLGTQANGGAVTHNVNSKSVESATFGIGFIANKSASGSSTSTDADGVAKATLSKSKIHTSSVLALPTDADSSPKGSVRYVGVGIAGANHGWADGAGDAQIGMAFPHGGYITGQILAGKGASGVAASSLDAEFSGTLVISAEGYKLPE